MIQSIENQSSFKPMRLGELLDRSFKLSPKVFYAIFPFYLISAVCGALSAMGPRLPLAAFAVSGPSWILGFVVQIMGIVAAYMLWHSSEPLVLSQVNRALRGKFGASLLKLLGIYTCIFFGTAFVTLLWMVIPAAFYYLLAEAMSGVFAIFALLFLPLLLIQPVLYFTRRLIAPVVMVTEGQGVFNSLEKSKKLMTSGKVFSSANPSVRLTMMCLITLPVYVLGIGLIAVSSQDLEFGFADLSLPVALGMSIISYLIFNLISALWMAFLVGLYIDTKARYEATDILHNLDNIGSASS